MIRSLSSRYQTLRPGLRKIVANTGWLVSDRILRMGVGLIVGVWVARYLGPEQFGLWNYAIAFVSLIGVLGTMGADNIVIRDIVRDPSIKGVTLGTTFVLRLIGGLLVVAISMIATWVRRPGDELLLCLVAISASALILRAFEVIDLWFQSQVRSKVTIYARNVAFVIVSALKIVLIKNHAPLLAFALADLLMGTLAAAGLVIAYRLEHATFSEWRVSFTRARQILSDSWPLLLSGLAVMVYMRIDQVMLEQMIGSGAVGLYTAATRVSEVWYFIPMALVASVFPSIVQTRQGNQPLYYQRLQHLFSLMAGIALAIAVPMTFLSGLVIHILYGGKFDGSGTILAIHIWAALFVFWGVAQEPWYLAEGFTKMSLLRTTVGAVLNIGLNVILIPRYQGVGAAIATVCSQAIVGVGLNLVNRKTRRIFRMQARSLLFVKDLLQWRATHLAPAPVAAE